MWYAVLFPLLACFAFAFAAIAESGLSKASCPPLKGLASSFTHADAVMQPEGMLQVHRCVAFRHRWDAEFPGRGGFVQYSMQIPPASGGGVRALILQKLGNQATVRIDGVIVDVFTHEDPAYVDAGKIDRLIVIPESLESSSRSLKLSIATQVQPLRGGGLWGVLLGSLSEMTSIHERQRLLTQGTSAAYAGCLLLMSGLSAGLWWRQRDRAYGTFSLAALLGAVRPLDQVLWVSPLPWPLWGVILAWAYALQLIFIARFSLIVIAHEPQWLVRSIRILIVSEIVLAALSFSLGRPQLWTFGLGLIALLGLVCLYFVAKEARSTGRRTARWTLIAGLVTVLAGVHDLVFVRLALFGGSSHVLAHHALFAFVVFLAGLVSHRYNKTSQDFKTLNGQLTERIAERERELKRAFDTLRIQAQEHAAVEERQRIMRDIHDGVGSQLVGLLTLVGESSRDPKELGAQVQHALDEMRMAVDSLQPVHGDLVTVLATLRYRLQSRLDSAHIDVVWDVGPIPPLAHLTPQAVLQVQRIVLEAVTNVIKHAQASTLAFSARWHPDLPPVVEIRLTDNGCGVGVGVRGGAAKGQGMTNMQLRASSIGANLSIQPHEGGGTQVVLRWPVTA